MLEVVLGLLILSLSLTIGFGIFGKKKAQIWSPMIFWSVYLIYYIIKPILENYSTFNELTKNNISILVLGALVSYISIFIGFNFKVPYFRKSFHLFNTTFNGVKIDKLSLYLTVLAFACYGIFKGFKLNFLSEDTSSNGFNPDGAYNNPTAYITYLVSCFALASTLSLAYYNKNKKKLYMFFIIIFIALCLSILEGFRYRILILFVACTTVYFLYPKVKKIKYVIVIPILLVVYIGMGIIEHSRSYGRGLNISNLQNMELSGVESSEGVLVCKFSSDVMNAYNMEDYIYFEPIMTAIFMPIPRSIFSEKPDGSYLREANLKVEGTISTGNAFLYFVEAYISFGWIGIVVQGLFIGIVFKLYWNNYQKHPKSLGAVTLLGIFNGFCFVWFSRGYLSQVFTVYIYYLVIPYWISKFMIRLFRKQLVESKVRTKINITI